MAEHSDQSAYDKALELNLDRTSYGVFAEIGAGQEVANWFFRVSASAGTVAKTISAYDMTMSDAIYGKAQRYVSRERMVAMLDHEYEILVERLTPTRGKETTFFTYANTVRARGYQDTAECYGWMGIRFQTKPLAPPSDILIHVRLLDHENADQMEALGIVGLNLIHGAFHHRHNLKVFAESLVDNLAAGRVEIDMLKFTGHRFEYVDNRLCALQLVQSGLATTAMFSPTGEVVQAAEALYNRPIVLLRGSFHPIANIHLELLSKTKELFCRALPTQDASHAVELCEISLDNMLRGRDEMDTVDFLNRVDALKALGKTVMISRCPEFYRLIEVLSRYTRQPIAIILSIGLLHELFKERWSTSLDGGVLESFGRLFKNGSRLYVSSWFNKRTGNTVSAESYRSPTGYRHLYEHFLENGMVNSVKVDDPEMLRYNGRNLLEMAERGEEQWRNYVPEAVQKYV